MTAHNTLIDRFVCPGCSLGSNTGDCAAADLSISYGGECRTHSAGTLMMPIIGRLALGLPKGFNRLGHGKLEIRVWSAGTAPKWDHLNVAVWAMEGNGDDVGFLFVRTLMPRTNRTMVDVIEGGTLALVPHAINVGKFIEEID